ncbi:MAG: hypothetical protein J07HQW2_01190 [Haloquadratum walsbyi J07HQW2]|uniref:Uncharacterized protein n=1 Tax=Haloquadratum walsbyi J07HQW2 TaxID=1238425 RepID=U1MWD7_9EURY|nr:MAG: hypothetical protein J07HQW2_01190 [Haloquadratum walsbyi J07HQW2]
MRQVRDQLPDLTDWWDDLTELYSTVTQAAVMRIEDSVTALSELKDRGYKIGSLNWKTLQEFCSFTYIQSGFEFDSKNGWTVLSLVQTCGYSRGETPRDPRKGDNQRGDTENRANR